MGKMYEALQKVERERLRDETGEAPRTVAENHVLHDKLVAYFEPSSIAAEQFRRLRTYILKPGMAASPKTILVTSAMAGEGKSLVAINLAITVATELHSHALLVDCDLRNPSLTRWFGFQEARGLSDYLIADLPLADVLIKTTVDKLSILPGGTLQENPTELVGSNKMKALIEDLKTRYPDRYIILDSSPLLATTEPSVLNGLVDGILLVVRAGVTPRESVQQALKLLDRKKIMGTVLNNLEFKTSAMVRRYFGTDRYYYRYRYSAHKPKQGFWRRLSAVGSDMKKAFAKRRAADKKE
jgi:exopolysaccharide/PEP-CTERM locus tyrosine autokinase